MRYWLMKSEPSVFGIDDLERVGTEPWDGVRNYQARNFMRDEMRPGDRALLYHSSCETPGAVGLMRITGPARPDPTAFDPEDPHYDPKSDPDAPRWYLVDVEFVRRLKRPITLTEMREHPELEGLTLLRRGNRLSVMPVDPAHWKAILALEKRRP